MKRIIALLLAVITAAVCFASCSDGDEGEVMGADNPYKADDIVMSSESFSYTRGEFSIAFYQYCNDFFSDSQAVDFYNVDSSVSLKEQVYHDDVTWFDYFRDMSVEYMKDVLICCEAAKAAGVELSEDDLDTIEDAVDSFVRYAGNYGYTEEEYFHNRFGADADQDALREYFKKEALAYKYQDAEISAYSFTEDELKAHAEKNWQDYKTIDYISYVFDEDDDANAKAAAEALAAITDAEAFDAYIIDYMTNTLELKKEEIGTEECHHNFKYFDKYSEFSKWAFEENGAVNTTYVKTNEVDGQYTVYLLTKAAAVRDDLTKNIRILAVDMAKHETSAKALSYAEELLQEWKDGEATEESFTALVKEKSNDTTAESTGGLIEQVAAGDDLPTGLEEWLYSEETVPGNADVFKGAGYYYIVYYCEDSDAKWRADAKNALTNEKYSAKNEELIEKHTIKSFDEVIESLDA